MAAAADAPEAVAALLLHGADAHARNAFGARPAALAKSDLVRGWLARAAGAPEERQRLLAELQQRPAGAGGGADASTDAASGDAGADAAADE